MADINHLISLGIGSPAAISEFITFGLQISDAELTLTDGFRRMTASSTKLTMDASNTRLSMDADSTKLTMDA